MSKREFTSFILKLLGIYAIIQSLPLLQYLAALPGMIGSDSNEAPRQVWLYIGLSTPFLLAVTVAVLLLVRSTNIARFIIKDDNDFSLPGSLSGREFQAICFSAVGVLVFLLAVPRLSQLFVSLWYLRSQHASGQIVQYQLVTRAWQTGISAAIQCGLAVILFFRSTGLANLWHSIQIAKYEKIKDPQPPEHDHDL